MSSNLAASYEYDLHNESQTTQKFKHLITKLLENCYFASYDNKIYYFCGTHYAPLDEIELAKMVSFIPRFEYEVVSYQKVVKLLLPKCHYYFTNRDFEINSSLINFKNAVLDTYTLEVFAHSPEYPLFNCLDTQIRDNFWYDYSDYNLLDMCPYFRDFLEDATACNDSKINAIKNMLASCLAKRPIKKAFFIIGAPDSGKSTFLRLIEILFGGRNISNIPLHQLTNKNNRAELQNKLINLCSEFSNTGLNDVNLLKSLVGGDRVLAERKYEKPFSFINTARFIFAGNGFPNIDDLDCSDGFINRLIFIEFYKSNRQLDPYLLDKMKKEAYYIMVWILQGYVKLMNYNFEIYEDEEYGSLKNKFMLESNSIFSFVHDKCYLLKDYFGSQLSTCKTEQYFKVSKQRLYNEYCTFCKSINVRPFGKKEFNAYITKPEHEVYARRTTDYPNKNNVHCFDGIQLRDYLDYMHY